MRDKHLPWPALPADGPLAAVHKPWFLPILPLGLPEPAARYLDALLVAYDAGQIDLVTALNAETLLLIHGWQSIDDQIDNSERLRTFWTNVFQMTRSPPS